jgi:hypothetical protein
MVFVGVWSSAVAQDATAPGAAPALTKEQIAGAIADGLSKRELRPYRIGKRASLIRSAMAMELGLAYTPYLRVALAARAARDAYKPFDANSVTPEMVDPLVYVDVPPQELVGARNPLEKYIDVETVLVMPKGARDPAGNSACLDEGERVRFFELVRGAVAVQGHGCCLPASRVNDARLRVRRHIPR